MVRCGISMYGLHPSDVTKGTIGLRPAMSVKARVTNVNRVPVGEGVSYGLRYVSPGEVEIATVPIGYADGIPRTLSGKMEVLHRGRLCPQVGTITMDQMMFELDLKGTPKRPAGFAELGDDVVIVGESDNLEITLDHLARKLGTINYELACRFGMRLEREYI
jgi:alanine racemase